MKQHTATAFLISREEPRRVLLLHHKTLNKWQPPGGHQHPDESPYQTVIRETIEETGIDITPFLTAPVQLDGRATMLPLPEYFLEEQIPAREDRPAHVHLDMVYVVEVPIQEAVLEKDEAHEIGWFLVDEAMQLDMFVNVRVTLAEIFDTYAGKVSG